MGKLDVAVRVSVAERRHRRGGFERFEWCLEPQIHLDSPVGDPPRDRRAHLTHRLHVALSPAKYGTSPAATASVGPRLKVEA